jgi:predicted anti-sigma-YlaC factor YlaD
MECREVKNNLSAYLDRELDIRLTQEMENHLKSCPGCLQESQQMSRAWEMLDLAPQLEPSPDYMSRFWTKAAAQESAHERFLKGIKALLGNGRLIPVATTLSLMLIIGSTVLVHQISLQNDLNQLKPDDIEMLQHIDLAEHFETLKDFGVIRDLDSVQKQGAV